MSPWMRPRAEETARLLSYILGFFWSAAFLFFTPPSYDGVISTTVVYLWLGLTAIGCAGAAVGVLNGRDLKTELPFLYIMAIGPFLYFVAQLGFISNGEWEQRLALAIFVLWHISLFLPRIVGLESYRRQARKIAKARKGQGR